MSFKLGLTGSIGMGKSTTARMFSEAGCEIWDADAAVHRLYTAGGAAVAPIKAAFPDCIEAGAVSRDRLKSKILRNPAALGQIEAIVHPLVAKDRSDFLRHSQSDIVVLDIPLLFETGGEANVDAVAVVSIDAKTQRDRVLARGTMTEEQFSQIREKQLPDEDKRARADYIIVTDTEAHARRQVDDIIRDIRQRMANHA